MNLALQDDALHRSWVNDNADENTFDVIKYLESFEDSDVYGSSGLISD